MDALTARASLGLSDVVAPAFSPGSGPGHMSMFGYDPLEVLIGRGVLEAMGIGFPLTHKDVAVRANFCTMDASGNITDRRAGRIPTEECAKRVEVLRQIQIPGVQIFVEPVKEYRFVLVLRGEGLGANIPDNDPQLTGIPALPTPNISTSTGFGTIIPDTPSDHISMGGDGSLRTYIDLHWGFSDRRKTRRSLPLRTSRSGPSPKPLPASPLKE